MSGVIPPIFASSILLFPATLATWIPAFKPFADAMTRGGWIYDGLYVIGIVFFCYFYTAVTFNPVDVADNLKKYGGVGPGRPPRHGNPGIQRQTPTRSTHPGRPRSHPRPLPADHP